MNIIPLSNVIELNIDSLNWILFRETIIDNDIKTSFFPHVTLSHATIPIT